MSLKNQIVFRAKVVIFIAAALSILVIVQLVNVQILQRSKWEKERGKYTIKTDEVEAERGNILSADGQILASSVPYFKLRIDFTTPKFNEKLYKEKIDSLAQCFYQTFPGVRSSRASWKSHLQRGLQGGTTYFSLLPQWVDYVQLDEVLKFPFIKEGKQITGFYWEEKIVRENPFGDMAHRTIGELDGDAENGIYGLEQSYDEKLKGKPGTVKKRKVGGRWIAETVRKPNEGCDLVTSINVTLQDVAESSLRRQLEKYNADNGCAVLMEVKTGNIMAITNLKKSGAGYKDLRNYAVGEASEPGSTFKLMSFVIAAEHGYLDTEKLTDTRNGELNMYGRKMTDSHRGGFGVISYRDVFVNSSNIGTAGLIDTLFSQEPEKYVASLQKMKVNEPTGIDIYGEPKPKIKNPGDKDWYKTTLPWMAMGYETLLTPLQILTFYNAIANDGVWVKPRIVQGFARNGSLEEKVKVLTSDKPICSKSTAASVQALMENVVDSGTARNLRGAHLKIAGKTGTAQVAQGNRGYRVHGRTKYKASFCGYFPADDPKYSCIVVVNNPTQNGYYGNIVAGPVFRDVADKLYSMNPQLANKDEKTDTIPPEYTVPVSMDGNLADLKRVFKYLDVDFSLETDTCDWVRTKTDKHLVEVKAFTQRAQLVPNVVGMGAMDAVYMLESAGLKVKVNGKGRVKRQSLRSGTRIKPGLNISLTLG